MRVFKLGLLSAFAVVSTQGFAVADCFTYKSDDAGHQTCKCDSTIKTGLTDVQCNLNVSASNFRLDNKLPVVSTSNPVNLNQTNSNLQNLKTESENARANFNDLLNNKDKSGATDADLADALKKADDADKKYKAAQAQLVTSTSQPIWDQTKEDNLKALTTRASDSTLTPTQRTEASQQLQEQLAIRNNSSTANGLVQSVDAGGSLIPSNGANYVLPTKSEVPAAFTYNPNEVNTPKSKADYVDPSTKLGYNKFDGNKDLQGAFSQLDDAKNNSTFTTDAVIQRAKLNVTNDSALSDTEKNSKLGAISDYEKQVQAGTKPNLPYQSLNKDATAVNNGQADAAAFNKANNSTQQPAAVVANEVKKTDVAATEVKPVQTDAEIKAAEAAKLAEQKKTDALANKVKLYTGKGVRDKQLEDAKNGTNKKLAREARKEEKAYGRREGITEDEDANINGCGLYGGAKCAVTQTINTTVMMADQVGTVVGGLAVSKAGSDANAKLASKGAGANGDDFANAQKEAAQAAKDNAEKLVKTDAIGGAIQTLRMAQHMAGSGRVAATEGATINQLAPEKKALEGNISRLNAQYSAGGCSAPTAQNAAACDQLKQSIDHEEKDLTEVNRAMNATRTNAKIEKKRQSDMANAQMMAVMQTGMNVTKHMAEMQAANALARQADLNKLNNQGPKFNYNPNGPANQANYEGMAGGPNAETGAVVADNGTVADGGLGADGTPQVNPGLDNGMNGGPAAGAFNSDDPSKKMGGGGGIGGLGSAGGTSASNGGGSADGTTGSAPGKTQGGAYGENGNSVGGGFKGGAGGGGGGIGIDNAFADLLKKMLPGGEDDKNKALADANADADRSPASDQAAVIDRNKNIFEEISKRYKKKSSEGAVNI